MTATCEMRTQGINQTMTRATGAYDAFIEACRVRRALSFFKAAFIPGRAIQKSTGGLLPLRCARPGTVYLHALQGFLVWENADRMISPHTAAMMVAGFVSPRATLRTVSGSRTTPESLPPALPP